MRSTTIPLLRYRDAEKAIDWLCRAFGFDVFLKVAEGGRVNHARLTLHDNMIMLATLGRDGEFEDRFKSPAAIEGYTQAISIVVPDPDSIHASAAQAGATIMTPLQDFQFGGRMFSCADVESHVWVFGSYDPWIKTW